MQGKMRVSPSQISNRGSYLTDAVLRVGPDAVDRKVRSGKFLFLGESDSDRFGKDAINDEAVCQGKDDGGNASQQLGDKGHSAQPAQFLVAENSGSYSTPGADDSMEWPDAQDIVDTEFLLFNVKAVDKDQGSDSPGKKSGAGVHDVTAGADGDEPRERAVVDETGVILACYQGK